MKTSKLFSRMFAAFGLVMMFAVSGWGDTEDNDNCSQIEAISEMHNQSGNYSRIEPGQVQNSDPDFYYFTIPQSGILTYSYSSTAATDLRTQVGGTCSTTMPRVVNNGTSLSSTNVAIAAGDTVRFHVARRSGTPNYSLTLSFAPSLPSVNFTTTTNSANEGNGNIPYTVTLSTSPTSAVSVPYTISGASANNSDFVTTTGTLNFAIGVTTQTLNVPVQDDTDVEPDETFSVTLGTPTGATLGAASTATGTITNDDFRTVSISPVSQSVTENNTVTTMDFEVTLSNNTATSNVTVAYTVTGSGTYSATSGTDVTPSSGTVTFLPGETSKTITLTIVGETLGEPDETFALSFSSPTNATLGAVSSATGTILNDDILSADLSVTKTDSKDPVTIGESYSYTLNVTNNGPSVATDVNVTDTLPNGMTYNGVTAAGWTCSYAEGKLQCLTSTLASGSSSSIIVNVTAPSAEGSITNTVSISSLINDPDTANNTASEQTQVNSNSADLAISITDSPDPVTTTGALTYTVTVQNKSAVSASGIQVIDILPSNLQFVSVSGTGWTCSQGQYIVCDYVQGAGALAGGSTTSAITINVAAPSTAGNVNNTVEVSSVNPDPVIANNTVIATTTVNEGTSTTTTGRTFSKYLQYNVYGDIKSIGNTVTWAPTTGTYTSCKKDNTTNQGCKNNGFDMQFVDIDGDASTYNSSSADLDLGDPSYEIVWAGLYWQGHIAPDATGVNTAFGGNASGRTQAQSIKFKTAGGSYVPVTAHKFDSVIDSGSFVYSGFADVTSLVHAQGTYTVANIPASEGAMSFLGSYGGWSLQVIYKDPTRGLHYKNVSIFDGFKSVPANTTVDIDIDGFVTPLSGPVNSSVSVFVADGDRWGSNSLGEHFYIYNQAKTISNDIYDAASPSGNVFNSAIAEFGIDMTAKNPNYQDNLGIDIHRFDVSSFVTNNQTSTRFRFTTTGDYYYVDFLGFATDMYTPVIDGFSKTATLNGTVLDATSILHAGDTLTYNLTFSNTGGETAKEVEIFDDFDLDGLNSVFNVDNFDASSIKLSVKNSTTTWQASPNCGYDSAQHKVWCKVAELKTGEQYTMQFAVTIKSSFSSEDNTSVTNTAYSKYKNGTTNEYVVLTSNGYGGQSNTNNAGTILAGGGVVPTPLIGNMDVIETTYYQTAGSYALADKNITTKITNKPFALEAVYLDTVGNEKVYNGTIGNNKTVNMAVMLYTSDTGTCSEEITLLWDGELTHNTSHVSASSLSLSKAFKDRRIRAKFIDYGTLINNATKLECGASSLNSSLCLVPACLNSDTQILKAFPVAQFPYVTTCLYGDGTIGTKAPCDSNAYNGNCGGKKDTISPSKYNNDIGCAMCLADALGMNGCSTDNFAARPEKLEIVSTHYDWANILRSGEEYNTTINAYNYNSTTNTQDYNVTSANTVFDINTTKYMKNNDINDSMTGTTTFGTSDFNISNGISVKSGFAGNEVAGLSFNDVGKINISLEDRVWSAVDNDDTPMNCDANGTYICSDINVTFIPHHFNFSALGITNNNGNTDSFTYLANEVALMAGRITAQMQARNKAGAITGNFSAFPLWENPVTVVPVVTKSTYLYPDANETNISNQSVGFSFGAKTIAWDEDNASQYLRFNFRRDINLPQDPFDVNGSNLNISMTSHYADGAKVADINGSRLSSGVADLPYSVVSPADGNSTFVYGRIIPRDVRVFGAVPFSANAWYEVFNAPRIGTTLLIPRKNENSWFINSLHVDTIDGDGIVTFVNSGAVNIGGAAAGGVETYGFGAQTPPYSAKAHINTDPWLWYGVSVLPYSDPSAANLECMTHPCFNINVVPAVGATGSAKSGSEENKASKSSSKEGTGWHSTTDYAPAIR